MIRYSLRCAAGHGFEAWFRSGEAYDDMREAAQVTCPECGETRVEKALMAPGVAATTPQAQEHPLVRLRREIEATSDYVGRDFAKRARAMHEGAEPPRAIYGEAAPAEARQLIREGVSIAPLPFRPKSKLN